MPTIDVAWLQSKTIFLPQAFASSVVSVSSTALSSVAAFGFDRAVAVASLSATTKLLSAIGLGGLAAQKPNVLDAAAVSALSRLIYWVFQPAFLLCSVGTTLYKASTGGAGGMPGQFLALMPLTAVLQISMGAIVGLILTKFASISDLESRDVRMCCAFANSGPLPLIFADALFNGTQIAAQVTACISFYLLIWSPLFWTFGRVILGATSKKERQARTIAGRIVQETKALLSPPVTGSILGVMVGGIPVLQKLFFRGVLAPVYSALNTLGSAYLPAALLVLAGSLVSRKPKGVVPIDGNAARRKTVPSTRAVISIFLARFSLAPLVSLGILKCFASMGLLGPAGTSARTIASFVILMEGCMPPAQNSVVLLQLEGWTERAASMAKLLTLMYSLAVVPVTLLLSSCLSISGILK